MVRSDARNGKRDHEHEEEQTAFDLRCLRSERGRRFRGVIAASAYPQRHRDIEAITAFVRSPQQLFAVASRLFLRHARRILDQALKVIHPPAQILFEPGELLRFWSRGVLGVSASACHGAPLTNRAASGRRNEERIASKTINGRVKAKPIWQHWPKEFAPSRRLLEANAGFR